MGQFLSCGIAKSIFVEKASYTKEEILKKLAKSIDLNIYKEPKENEEYLFLDLKKKYYLYYIYIQIIFQMWMLRLGKHNTSIEK